jgi:sugar phosphate isomerase/epimerase
MTMNRRRWMGGALALGSAPLAPLFAAREPHPRSGKPMQVGLAAYSFRTHFEFSRGKANAKFEPGERAMDMLKFIDYCAEHGASAELTSYFFPPDAGPDYFAACRDRAAEKGVAIAGSAVGNNFSHPEGSPERAEQMAYVKEWIEICASMGAPHLRVFAGVHPKGIAPEQAEANAISALEEAAVLAAQRKVYLGIENHDSVTTADRLLRIVRAVKSPWVGVNLDSGNFIADDVYAEIAASAPYAVNVQVKTEIRVGPGGKEKAPADLARVAAILKESGYDGHVVLEYEEDGDPYESVPPLLDRLRELLA